MVRGIPRPHLLHSLSPFLRSRPLARQIFRHSFFSDLHHLLFTWSFLCFRTEAVPSSDELLPRCTPPTSVPSLRTALNHSPWASTTRSRRPHSPFASFSSGFTSSPLPFSTHVSACRPGSIAVVDQRNNFRLPNRSFAYFVCVRVAAPTQLTTGAYDSSPFASSSIPPCAFFFYAWRILSLAIFAKISVLYLDLLYWSPASLLVFVWVHALIDAFPCPQIVLFHSSFCFCLVAQISR